MEEELLKLILFEMREFKSNIKVLQEDMTEVKSDVKEVKGRLKNVEELAEFNKETCEAIIRVTTQQYKDFKEFENRNNKEHKKYDSKILDYKVEEEDDNK